MDKKEEYIAVVANLLSGSELKLVKAFGYKSLLINSNTWISMEKALEADVPVEVNLNNEEELMEKVQELRKKYDIKAVFSLNEYRVPIAAKIREFLGLPYGIPYKAAINCRNKKMTRKILEELGEEAVKYAIIQNVEEALNFVKDNGLPVVIKPSNDAGSQLVFCCKTSAEVEEAVASVMSTENNLVDQKLDAEFLIEEFLDGPEFSVESIAYNGKVSVVAITAKKLLSPFKPIEVGHTVPALLSPQEEQAIKNLVEKANELLGIDYTVTHTEVKLTQKGPRIVEVNARPGGDNIPLLVEAVKGIDLYETMVAFSLGREAHYKASCTSKADIRYFIAEHDGYAHFKDMTPLYKNEKVKTVNLSVSDGKEVTRSTSNYDRMGYFLCYDEEDTYIEEMAGLIEVTDKSGDSLSEKAEEEQNDNLDELFKKFCDNEVLEKNISDREYAIALLVRAFSACDHYKKIRAVIYAKSVGITTEEIIYIYSIIK